LDIDSVEVVGAAVEDELQRLTFRVHVRSALHVVDLAGGSVVEGDDTVRPWQADLTLIRRAGAITDPYREADSGVCPACAAPLRLHLDPLRLAALGPAAGPARGASEAEALAPLQRPEHRLDGRLVGRPEGGGVPDVMEHPVAVEPEQQGADTAVLVDPVAAD